MTAIEARLERLEVEVRELRCGAGAPLTLPLHARDAEGRLVLTLTLDDHGPQLALCGVDGKPLVILGATSEGGELAIRSRQGEMIAMLGAMREGGFLDIKTQDGDRGLILATHKDRTYAYTYDREAEPCAGLPQSES